MVRKLFNPATISVNFVSKDGDLDWLRSIQSGKILVNNVNTQKFLEDFPLGPEADTSSPNFKSLMDKIWDKEIVSQLKVSEKEKTQIRDYIGMYGSQDGFLHALKTAIMKNVAEAGYALDSRSTESVMNFIPQGKKLIIEERVSVNKIVDVSNPENELTSDKKNPLCVGTLKHEISIDKEGKVKHKIAGIDFKYGQEAKIPKIIDHRSILTRVTDFFKNLMGTKQKITPGKPPGPN